MSNMSDFGVWLTGVLQRKGWSQSELARRAKINQVTVSRIVNEGRNVGPRVARKMAYALGLPEEEIFQRAGLLKGLPQDNKGAGEYIKQRLPLISPKRIAALIFFLDHLLESERAEREIDHDESQLDDENET